MGRKFRLSLHLKNEERKSRASRAMREAVPPEKKSEASLIVSLPIEYYHGAGSIPLSVAVQPEKTSLVVSLPIESYHAATSVTLQCLKQHVETAGILPIGWKDVSSSDEAFEVACIVATSKGPTITIALSVDCHFQWTAHVNGKVLTTQSPLFARVKGVDHTESYLRSSSPMLNFVSAVKAVLHSVADCHVCVGNPDHKYQALAQERKGRFMNQSGTTLVACVESTWSSDTIRSAGCLLLIQKPSTCCTVCIKYRVTLNSLLFRSSRSHDTDTSHPSSHTNYRYLRTPQKASRLHRLQYSCKASQVVVSRLKQKLSKCMEVRSSTVDCGLSTDLQMIMEENTRNIEEKYKEGSFPRVFWEQQQMAIKAKRNGVRWDPLMIRWCLYLRHLSSSAYELLRQSGVVSLPSQRTLRDYTYYTTASAGFSVGVDEQLMRLAKIDSCTQRDKYVILLMDEMHIKSDLVYDKHTGGLIGFANIGDINTHLLAFEHDLEAQEREPLADSVLVLMVRGLFSKLEFPYVQFPCTELSGEKMYDPFWEAVERLERCGFRVMALVCDGLAANRRLFKLHNPSAPEIYKVPNPYSSDGRSMYFLSDVPHLMKTTRNAWSNNKRKLWNQGKEITWAHLHKLYEVNRSQTGLSLIPKLKYEHLNLTSFSKMRVDLAAQVLSSSVASALQLLCREEAEGTSKFAEMFDKFFDCLNVRSLSAGKHSRNPFKSPFRAGTDWRIKWLEDDFLGYLSKWERSVEEREHFSRLEKRKMMLSPETLLGLRITVKAFIELVQFIFTIPGVDFFFSNRLCQDPLEKFFGQQRQRGRVNENPNASDFFKNTQALRVVNGLCRNVRGNCRGGTSTVDETLREPLKKRKRRRRNPTV